MTIHKGRVFLSVLFVLGLSFALTFVMTGCSNSSSKAPVYMSLGPNGLTLEATQTQQFTAEVYNANDKSVAWDITECGGDACGTISSAGLYTAPPIVVSSTMVNITATSHADPSKFITVSVNLVPLSVTVSEDLIALGANEEHQFSASVVRHPNTAVIWSLSECTASDCGSIDASGLYVSPSIVPNRSSVTVTARSEADPTKHDSAIVYNMPLEVSVTPPRMTLSAGTTINFWANVKQDIMNAGVTWALETGCSPETCGTLTDFTETSVTYTAPEAVPDPSTVTLVATSITDTDKTAEVNITISDTLTLLEEGDYAFYFNGDAENEEGYPVWAAGAGRFYCDGHGAITDGVQDLNLPSGVSQSVPFIASYTVGPDFRGSLEMFTSEDTFTYLMSVDPSGTGGRFISFDDSSENASMHVTGYFERQDKNDFSLSAITGPYAIGASSGGRGIAAVGRFDIGADGELSSGRMDTAEDVDGFSMTAANLTLEGSISAPSSTTGRGTVTLSLTPTPPGGESVFNFAYYILSSERMLLVQTDDRTSVEPTALSGEIRHQAGLFSASSFDEPDIFSVSGMSFWGGNVAAIGRIIPDGLGAVTGKIDQNNPYGNFLLDEFYGSYTVESDGRADIMLDFSSITQNYVAYFYGQNQGFLLQASGDLIDFMFGEFEPQVDGPFTLSSISDTYLTNTMAGLSNPGVEKSSGVAIFDQGGIFTSSIDISCCSQMHLAGSYSVAPNGRGTITFDSQEDGEMIFWIISPEKLLAISTTGSEYHDPVLVEYRR